MRSDNSYYDPYEVSLADVREIWYVRAKISPFLPSPQNLQNFLYEELKQLQNTIHQQNELIGNLNKTIQQLVNK